MLTGQGLVAAVGLPGLDDGAGQLSGGRGAQAEVEETGSGDLHGGDAVEGLKTRDEELGEVARLGARLLGQLHGDVGGPIAVVAVAGALDAGKRHILDAQGEGAVCGGSGQDGAGRFSELFWGHGHRVAEQCGDVASRRFPRVPGSRGARGGDESARGADEDAGRAPRD